MLYCLNFYQNMTVISFLNCFCNFQKNEIFTQHELHCKDDSHTNTLIPEKFKTVLNKETKK